MKRALRELKGVGEKTEKLFAKLGITDTEELLRYYPRNYEAYEEPVPIGDLKEGTWREITGKELAELKDALKGQKFYNE